MGDAAPAIPAGRLRQDFLTIASAIVPGIRRLFISQQRLKRFQRLYEPGRAAAVAITEDSRPVPAQDFFTRWSAFRRALSDFFAISHLNQFREFFQPELSLVRSSILAFSGPP
jgi:hypothetical protein